MSAPAGGPLPTALPQKPIRFVNSEGQPRAKRRRTNAACQTCRKRKTRCDGKRPLCSTCIENGHECLGYVDGEMKKEAKQLNANRNVNVSDNDREEDIRNGRNGAGNGLQASRIASLRRGESQGHIRNVPEAERERATSKENDMNFSGNFTTPMDRSNTSRAESHRVPYFRYFGPTAIVPGFKQMVVSVREHRRSTGADSSVAISPASGGYIEKSSAYGGMPSQASRDTRPMVEMPVYDQNDHLPVHRLIIHLVETFFAHLGSNFPFLRQKSFTQRVEERSVEAILVDAVCALAARFSDHPILGASQDSSSSKSEYGHAFAQRAKAAVVDTFPRPTVAATQACLLLAYEGFGSNQDSALWMYLGCAIRMAVDLGLQKLDGVKYQGQKDPGHRPSIATDPSEASPVVSLEEMKEIEQERINTLWAVFMLDRVISSGTGRPVTLRDEDFELSFPAIMASTKSGWPDPFPALIQIIHLYGRVSDLLNNIRSVRDVTPKKIEGLAAMEKDLTHLYQKLDTRLNFNASNFQHYCRAGEGTNFILVHFWFHTLIMLLHQPTLMHSFEGQILSLLPHSRELSMSSAKTIADILAFAELIDPRSFIGNPFTSQPMYIAACAFLMESAAHSSNPTSRDTTPPTNWPKQNSNIDEKSNGTMSGENKQKHSLLASAANQNYQRCYKALQQLEIYWAGTRYILVALDQKSKGIWDPETYTEQEYEATKTKPDMIPNWRRKLSLTGPSTPVARFAGLVRSPRMEPGSISAIDPSQAIGWSLTGTTNSPNSNLTFMYQNMTSEQVQNLHPPLPGAGNMIYDPIRASLPESTAASTSTSTYSPGYQQYPLQSVRRHSPSMLPPVPKYGTQVYSEPVSTSDAEMLLGLQNSPFAQLPGSHKSFYHAPSSPALTRHETSNSNDYSQNNARLSPGSLNGYTGFGGGVVEMMMQSQEIDMSTLGGDMMPWLEYLPQNMLDFFDNSGGRTDLGGV